MRKITSTLIYFLIFVSLNAVKASAGDIVLYPKGSCNNGALIFGTGAGAYVVQISDEAIVNKVANAIAQSPDTDYYRAISGVSITHADGKRVVVMSGSNGYFVSRGARSWNPNDASAAFAGSVNGVSGWFVRFSNSTFSDGAYSWKPLFEKPFFFPNCQYL